MKNLECLVQIQVEETSKKELSAHVVVHVSVEDKNDNPPVFLNLPYHCTVSVDAKEGEVIQVVSYVRQKFKYVGHLVFVLIYLE